MSYGEMIFAEGEESHLDYFVWPVDQPQHNAVRVKFFGCNSLWISNGETNLLIDPYFSRPNVGPPLGLRPRFTPVLGTPPRPYPQTPYNRMNKSFEKCWTQLISARFRQLS